jgi:hypothetical protein
VLGAGTGAVPEHGPAFVFVTEDSERSLQQIGKHFVHASNMYAPWATERPNVTVNGYWEEKEGIESIKSRALGGQGAAATG